MASAMERAIIELVLQGGNAVENQADSIAVNLAGVKQAGDDAKDAVKSAKDASLSLEQKTNQIVVTANQMLQAAEGIGIIEKGGEVSTWGHGITTIGAEIATGAGVGASIAGPGGAVAGGLIGAASSVPEFFSKREIEKAKKEAKEAEEERNIFFRRRLKEVEADRELARDLMRWKAQMEARMDA